MAASTTDLFTYVGNPGTATTLSAPGYTSGGTSINVGSTTNFPTSTAVVFAIDEVETVGGEEVRTVGTYNTYRGIVASGTSITNVTWLNGDGDRDYAAGAGTRVYITTASAWANRLVDGLSVEHNKDGTHSTITGTSINLTGAVTSNTISEKTAANGVTVDGLNIKDGKLNTNDSVVTTNITDANVTTAKIADDAVTPAKWTNPYCFKAYASGGTTLTDATFVTIALATEAYDYNNNFASNTYTAPVAGVYFFSGGVGHDSTSATSVSAMTSIYVDGTERIRGDRFDAPNTAGNQWTVSGEVLLAAGAAVTLRHYQDSAGNETSATGESVTYFSGHLVHAT